jgi:hypothetical protein
MKLTVIPADKSVYLDGKFQKELEWKGTPKNVHALQWNNVKGWIEYISDDDGNKLPNELITELPKWALNAVTAWEAAEAAEE